MSVLVLDDASVVVNSVDLSDHVESVTLNLARDKVEMTTMGDNAHKNVPGLMDESIEITFKQDFATSKVDVTLYPLYGNGTSHTVVVKPTSAAPGATNPTYTLTGYIEEYPPLGGSVGDGATTQVKWMNGAGAGIVRATA